MDIVACAELVYTRLPLFCTDNQEQVPASIANTFRAQILPKLCELLWKILFVGDNLDVHQRCE